MAMCRKRSRNAAASREALEAIPAEEPFVKAKKTRSSRITEFDAAQFQPSLKDRFAVN